MEPSIHLLIHNIGMGISGVIAIGLGIFVYFNNPKRTANVIFALTMVSVAVFTFSHIIGVSISDPYLSRSVLMFNVSIIFIVMFNTHCILNIIGKEKERRNIIILIYAIGIALTLVYLLFPETFLALSVPKMYFLNYYSAGTYQWIMRLVFNFIIPIYFMSELVIAYRQSANPIERNRYLYFLAASIVGYSVGSIPILLVYNIQVDPAWGALFILFYAIPFVYGIVKYELFDIRIIAKKAFLYSVAIAGTGAIITLFNLSNQLIEKAYPGFPFWITPLITAFLAVSIAVFAWKKLREGDILKYEFITTVTHKFRTPLTHIKWATENLTKAQSLTELPTQLEYIGSANEKLVELTNLLVNVSEDDDNAYSYNMEKVHLSNMAKEVIDKMDAQFKMKHLKVISDLTPDLSVTCDVSRIQFVIQTLVENAINYTHDGGEIIIKIYKKDTDAIFSVTDTGIGIPKNETHLLFSKFYRGSKARSEDTEGMGIGLFISKKIIVKHNGRIWAESEGESKGSTFLFSLPIVKSS